VDGYKSTVPVEAALWKEDGEGGLGACKVHPKAAFEIVDRGQIRVRAITMPTLLRGVEIHFIDLLEVDIEGAEKEVFESCDWIERDRILRFLATKFTRFSALIR
jgi:hypothetical protein